MKLTTKKLVGLILGVVSGVIVGLLTPPADLTPEAMRAMGVILCAILLMVFDVFPTYVITTLMCTSFVLFKCVGMTVAFSAFADTNFWLIVAVIAIGVAVQKSGLVKRISFKLFKLFPPTFKGTIAALLGIGMICQPLMPSTSAKQSIAAPVAVTMGETLGYEKKSKPMAGLFNAVYVGWSILASLFISASFLSYMYFGNLPEDVQAQVSWGKWVLAALPWAIVVLVGMYFAIVLLYNPKDGKVVSREAIDKSLADMGPMKKEEKISAVIMIICIILWILERKIGVAACTTALLGMVAMAICGLFTPGDFNTKMGWPLLFYVGGILNISTVMGKLNISNWLGGMIAPLISGLISKPYLFVAALVVIIYAARFVIASPSTTSILLIVVFTPVAQSAGINPWILLMVAYCSTMIWVVKYQNSNMLVGWAAFGGDEQANYSDVVPGAVAYLVVNLVALLISIPFWKLIGFIA